MGCYQATVIGALTERANHRSLIAPFPLAMIHTRSHLWITSVNKNIAALFAPTSRAKLLKLTKSKWRRAHSELKFSWSSYFGVKKPSAPLSTATSERESVWNDTKFESMQSHSETLDFPLKKFNKLTTK
ncbi:hypothetical protein Y032_0008g223 [Ancylostoma ceylanicum]|uniref:Uncharacterized protein n=1 Tax=Ancylostoma ceylanicum TaxID=53326 RepID=A0A016VKN5_9BILA|nr:hypothetical protein Y032_0008g223 [Ancylostoma ceylanicum]